MVLWQGRTHNVKVGSPLLMVWVLNDNGGYEKTHTNNNNKQCNEPLAARKLRLNMISQDLDKYLDANHSTGCKIVDLSLNNSCITGCINNKR
jgi:hypothetical protein